MIEALQLAAAEDGLVFDPVYTGKALAALVNLLHTGRFAGHERVSSSTPPVRQLSSPAGPPSGGPRRALARLAAASGMPVPCLKARRLAWRSSGPRLGWSTQGARVSR
jgi:hypothetical protein